MPCENTNQIDQSGKNLEPRALLYGAAALRCYTSEMTDRSLNTAPYAIAFAGNPLNRHSEHRPSVEWLAKQLASTRSQFIPLYGGDPLLIDGAPAFLQMAAKQTFPAHCPFVFLGIDERQTQMPIPTFALDATNSAAKSEQAPFADIGHYSNLRGCMGTLDSADLAIIGQARWLLDWHRRHQFCAVCGQPSEMVDGGAKRHCPACGADHFPRTEPVAIVLVINGDECLLGRGPNFPPGFLSALAGFAEPGETIEECAIREIYEEAGVHIHCVDYQFSQPWPFPSSMMMGFFAYTDDKALTLDRTEIEEARWVPKAQIRSLLVGEPGDLFIPPDFTIAHHLLKRWAQS